jgi:DNA-binding MarR family transcriptional regulator
VADRGYPSNIWIDVFSVNQVMRAVIDRALAGVAGPEFALYSVVAQQGPVSPSQVSRVLGLPLTTASDRLNRAVERGHMSREVNARDRRSYLFSLSEEGRTLVAAGGRPFGALARRVEQRLELPVEEVRAALAALDQALRAEFEDLDPENAPPP